MGGIVVCNKQQSVAVSSSSTKQINEKKIDVPFRRSHPTEKNGPYTILYKIGE